MSHAAATAGTVNERDELLDAFDIDALIVTRDGLLATSRWPTAAALAEAV